MVVAPVAQKHRRGTERETNQTASTGHLASPLKWKWRDSDRLSLSLQAQRVGCRTIRCGLHGQRSPVHPGRCVDPGPRGLGSPKTAERGRQRQIHLDRLKEEFKDQSAPKARSGIGAQDCLQLCAESDQEEAQVVDDRANKGVLWQGG